MLQDLVLNPLRKMLRLVRHHRARVVEKKRLSSQIGRSAAEKFLELQKLSGPLLLWTLHPKQTIHPLSLRVPTSDLSVFSQIFIDDEYGPVDMADGGLIIDLGANIGCSAAYFLSRFPRSHLVALEPDPKNFILLTSNLRAYGDRAIAINAGAWSHPTSLLIRKEKYRDGGEWARQVEEFRGENAHSIRGIDVASLLADLKEDHIALLKIDIEGAEAVLFSENYDSWIGKVDIIVIELHDDSVFGNGTQIFLSAISGRGFKISHSGELTICKRERPYSSPPALEPDSASP